MEFISRLLVGFVAFSHVGFLVLEMFLWRKGPGLKVFRNTPEKAEITAVLAANQGLYNGFLAAALVWGLADPRPDVSWALQIYGLACVIVAGVYGSWSVSSRILWIQAAPAALAATFLFLS